MTLADIEKFHVLTAVVKCEYDLVDAAGILNITPRTIYRMFERWKLETPMKRGNPHTLAWRVYQKRCEKILSALESIQLEAVK